MNLNDTKTFTTPEQVAITYSLAGIGTRFAAVLVDTLLQFLVILLLLFGYGLLTIGVGEVADYLFSVEDYLEGWLMPAVIVSLFLGNGVERPDPRQAAVRDPRAAGRWLSR